MLFTYFLFPALLHVAPSDSFGYEDTDEEMDGDETQAPQPSAAHQESRRWATIIRAYLSLLVAVRAVAGFKPASAPDVTVGFNVYTY